MILLGLDVETTGLDTRLSEITEVGWAIFDTNNWDKPFVLKSMLMNIESSIPQDISDLTGITNALLTRAGRPAATVINELLVDYVSFKVDAFVAHNAKFDRAFIETAVRKNGLTLPDWHWIDTKAHIDFPKRIRQRSLISLAAEHGFLNPFPHAAVFDVFTMMKILSKYDIEKVFSASKEPVILVQALVDFENKNLAKERGYSWEKWDDVIYPKKWVKALRQSQVEEEVKAAKFTIQTIGAL